MRPYVIFGAGAVGSALGAYLGRRGHRVLLISREPHAAAVTRQEGIRVISRSETFPAPVEAVSRIPSDLTGWAGAAVFVTVQTPDFEAAATEVRGAFGKDVGLVTWQNGIQAEEIAARLFTRVNGGVVRFTATSLTPGEVRVRKPGVLILGLWPSGTDEFVASVAADLSAAGFEAAVTTDIRSDKVLKLMVNLVSGPPVLIRRTGKEPVLSAVQVAVLEEAVRVFSAAGVGFEPHGGIGKTAEEMLAFFHAGGSAPDTSGGIYNSTWQNLHLKRGRLENAYYHGEVISLGKEAGVPTPVNQRVLEVLEAVCAESLGPEPFDREAFRRRFEGVVEFGSLTGPVEAGDTDLEI